MASSDKHDGVSRRAAGLALGVLLAVSLSGCSVRAVAVRSLGDALAEGGASWSADDDPELIRDAMPFALKTTESLLAEAPDHRGLLLSATSSFTQYAYAFVQCEADYVEDSDLKAAIAMRARAGRLYRRAFEYGMRGLEVAHPGFGMALRADPTRALGPMTVEDVPLLYWTGMAWGARIALDKTSAELMADLPLTERLVRRARELDPAFGAGAIFDFYISYEGGRPASAGGSEARAREALDEAMRRASGRRVAPLVSFAETVSVARQDRTEFERLLEQALELDAATTGDQRLANLIAQRRASWLLAKIDDLFIE